MEKVAYGKKSLTDEKNQKTILSCHLERKVVKSGRLFKFFRGKVLQFFTDI